jgi:hypothetical protein
MSYHIQTTEYAEPAIQPPSQTGVENPSSQQQEPMTERSRKKVDAVSIFIPVKHAHNTDLVTTTSLEV